MAKQIKRLREALPTELVSLDSVIIRMVETPNSKGKKMPSLSIRGTDLEAQVSFNDYQVETTTADGKNVYYRLRPTLASGIQLPTEEGYYSLENTDVWVDKQPENEGKHILRFSQGSFKLTGKFKNE